MSLQWYARYSGDYMRDTGHLSLAQHGAYNRLLDHYYATGRPLPNDNEALARLCCAMTPEERAVVAAIADEFFQVNADGLRHNKRADIEIKRRMKQHEALSEAGSRGAASREARLKPGMKPGMKPGISKTTSTTTTTGTSMRGSTTGKPSRTARRMDCDDEWLGTISDEYRKIGIDVDKELVKARAWLTGPKGRGRALTRQFLLNWLNNADHVVRGGQAGDSADPRQAEWKRARDEVKEAIWRAKEQQGDIKATIRAARDKFGDCPRLDGVDAVQAGIELALNNRRAAGDGEVAL